MTAPTALITDHWGVLRVIVLRGHLWFYEDDEVLPFTPDAQEHDGHWYRIGWGVAVPG